MLRLRSDFDVHMEHELLMVRIRPSCRHSRHLSSCATVTPKPVSKYRSNWCQVSKARRWQLASCQHLLPARCFFRCLKETEIIGTHSSNWIWDWLRHYG